MLKRKVLASGTVVTCDGTRHRYHDAMSQQREAWCWCRMATKEQLAEWEAVNG